MPKPAPSSSVAATCPPRIAGELSVWRAIASEEARVLVFVAASLLLYSVFFATLIGGFGPEPFGNFWTDIRDQFVSHLIAALPMVAVIELARRLGPRDGWRRAAVISVALAAATAVAWAGRLVILWLWDGQDIAGNLRHSAPIAVRYFTLAALLVIVAEFQRREMLSLEAMRAAETQRASLEQELLHARVKTLEAQIEPHFLFNTLANVRRLYEVDATAGDTMLGRLMRYLDVALPSMRDDRSTLEREAQLIGAYLDLQKVRMGRRLDYAIDIPPALRLLTVPPMMLLTLVENAIKHGLVPQRQGGRVDVTAEVVGTRLQLRVADTGRGFGGGTSGGGTGLANIRARLVAMFGSAGSLTLAPGDRSGLVATLSLPAAA